MAERETMNVSVTPEQKAFVKAQVEAGLYQSDSEVVRAGLRLLQREESQRKLEKLLLESLESEAVEATPDYLRDLGRRIDEHVERGRQRRAKRA